MILKIDSTKREEVMVELTNEKTGITSTITKTQQTGSQVLIPAIMEIIKKEKITIKDITQIEVNGGPGSFTGTRVGVAIANALGFALNIPVNGKKGKIVIPIYEKSKFD